jgi:hypothetical protein
MEKALKTSPESVIAEPFLFNLCTCRLSLSILTYLTTVLSATLYELRSATAIENKRNLLIEVAKWSGGALAVFFLYLRFSLTPVSKMD